MGVVARRKASSSRDVDELEVVLELKVAHRLTGRDGREAIGAGLIRQQTRQRNVDAEEVVNGSLELQMGESTALDTAALSPLLLLKTAEPAPAASTNSSRTWAGSSSASAGGISPSCTRSITRIQLVRSAGVANGLPSDVRSRPASAASPSWQARQLVFKS